MCAFSFRLKLYKKKLRDWGIRKNIRAGEALQVASGQAHNLRFWPAERSSDYNLRIARHLGHLGKCLQSHAAAAHHGRSCIHCCVLQATSLTLNITTTSMPTYTSKGLASVEMGLYYAEIFFQAASDSKLLQWSSTPATLKHLEFEVLFTHGLKNLVRNSNVERAFADIDRAFDLLKSLIEADHPSAYHTLVNSMALCKAHPESEVCFKVCRMLAKQSQQLGLVILGSSHPIHPCFAADVGMVEHGEAGEFAMFLNGTQSLCVQYGATCG